MANNGGKGRMQPGETIKVNINLDDLEDVVCPVCQAKIFGTNLVRMKRVGALHSPSGRPMIIKIETVICIDCESLFQVVNDQLVPVKVPALPEA